jgi:retinoid hydroxylase
MISPVACLPPGSAVEPATDELQTYMREPIGFLWNRYRQYGRIFTAHLGKPTVFMVGPEANKFILHDRMDCFSSAQTWPPAVRSLVGDEALSFHDGEHYLRLLQIVSPAAFGSDTLHHAFESLQACVARHTQRWAAGGPTPVLSEVRGVVNEAMFRWMMGDCPTDMGRLKELYKALTFIPEARGQQTRSQDLPWTRHCPSADEWQAKVAARDELRKSLQSVVAERRHFPTVDAISHMCQKSDKAGRGLTDSEIVAQILNLISAGTDALSTTATWLFDAVARYPEVRATLRAEIEAVVGHGPFTWQHLSQLPYLTCVLKEVERMRPPALAPARVVVKPIQFDDYEIPLGWTVRYALIISHFLPEVFAHPDTFDPERFAPPREEDKRTPYSLVGFGGGARHCLGKPFAKIFLQTLMVFALRRYDWSVAIDENVPPTGDRQPLKSQLKMVFAARSQSH